MRLLTLTLRDRRVLAVGLLLCVLALAYVLLLHWWLVAPLQQIRSEMSGLRDAHSQYAATIAEAPTLRARILALDVQQAASSAFWGNDDPNSAVAALMQRVVDAVAAHTAGGNCTINQKLLLPNPPVKPGDPYRKAAVNLNLSCDMQPLVAVLQTLEEGSPYAFIDDLSIYRNPVATQQRNAPPLEVQFTLSGYLRPAHAIDANAATAPASGTP